MRSQPSLARAAIACVAALLGPAAACSDSDFTQLCPGPGCPPPPDAGGAFGGAAAGGRADAGSGSEPCRVSFLAPTAADGGDVHLGAADDRDGEACGPSFSAAVVVSSNAASVRLFVNDNPLASASLSDGSASFDAVLGNRGATGNALRAEASLSDGRRCSAELPGVFVDCAGPSCSIEAPRASRAGFLNQGHDADGASPGLQTAIRVRTEPGNAGEPVRLELDGELEAIPSATVLEQDGVGLARFEAVTLEEGVHVARAECRDSFGGLTSSPPVQWSVDLSPCSLAIDAVAGGASPITPDLDLDGDVDNGLDVLIQGSIAGDGCESLQVGECGAEPTDIQLGGLLGSDGSVIVPYELPAQTASRSLCARVTDAAGNTSPEVTRELDVRVDAPGPGIAITSPRPPAVLTLDDDCDLDALGLQIDVRGTSDAADGSPVELTIGGGTPATTTLAGGSFSACVPAPDGEGQTLTARVTDSDTGLAASASVSISTSTSPPPAIGAPGVTVIGRRQGTLELSWTSVLDASGDPLVAYHLRCSRTSIASEAIWDAASPLPVSVSPALVAGVTQTQAVTGFRTGTQRFCMVRGEDAYGQLSALADDVTPTVASVSNPFLTLEYGSVLPTPVTGARVSLAAVGDVNGDGQNDFAYGTQNGGALVYFGGPALDAAPDVTISPPPVQSPNAEFGANVAGVGDVNGDGRPDFAITARVLSQPGAALGGAVFLFFGRAASDPWPASIAVAPSPGCGADVCFHSSEASAALGSALTSTDFDGDGISDLIIGAQNRTADDSTQRVGRVYVLLGGSQLDVPSGSALSLPGASLNGFSIDPPSSASRNFGVNVAGVGLGSDARGDLVISAVGRNAGGETVSGEAFSVPGRAYGSGGGLEPVSAGNAFAVGTPNGFGNPMRAVGDVNADGFGDVWISTNFDLNGVAPVYLGRSNGYSGVALLGFTNDVVDNEWGAYVATGFHTELGRLGDLDADGFDEVLVGSVFANGTPGSADLFYGDATTNGHRRSLADARIASSGNGQVTPSFVGDIDGDGFGDVALLDSGPALAAARLTLLY